MLSCVHALGCYSLSKEIMGSRVLPLFYEAIICVVSGFEIVTLRKRNRKLLLSTIAISNLGLKMLLSNVLNFKI